VSNEVYYWTPETIMKIVINGVDNYEFIDTCEGKIKKMYRNISKERKRLSFGAYHERDNYVQWLYTTQMEPGKPVDPDPRGLIYNRKFSAWTRQVYSENPSTGKSTLGIADIYYNKHKDRMDFLCFRYDNAIGSTDIIIQIFSEQDDFWIDYDGFENTSQRVIAQIDLGYVTGGETARDKKINYLTVQYHVAGDPDYAFVTAPLETFWDWNRNAQNPPQNTYRIDPRLPTSWMDYEVITTRNKVRGSGKEVLFRITEDDALGRFQLYSWGINASIETKV
jgi:hypothetical protein